MLPSNMKGLVNLRHLDIRGTHLQEMPKGMNKLKGLHFLSDYIVGGCDENGIKELGALADLHGSLAIHKLENVRDSHEASEARMIGKVHIDYLEFNWSSHCYIAANFRIEKIFDKLQPCTELKAIKVEGYTGKIFSDWLGHSSYHSMTTLTLTRCRNCCRLPSLGQLPSLKHLAVSYFDKLTSIGAEFYKNDEFCHEAPFPSLETLVFDTLFSWQAWHSSQFDAAFSQLKKLSIGSCPMLTGDLPNPLPALQELRVKGCKLLDCSLPSAPSIRKLRVHGASEVRFKDPPLSLCSESPSGSRHMESAPEAMTHTQLTCLRSLFISNCSSAISFPGACLNASLKDLKIRDCKKLQFPMQQQQQQESLQRLTVYKSCDSLTSFPLAAFPNLTRLEIYGCVNLRCLEVSVSQSKDDVALLPSLRYLTVERCPSFVSLLSRCSQKNVTLPGLRKLRVDECRSFVSFSTLGKVAPQLEDLSICDCPEIDSFGEDEEEEGNGSLPPTLRYLRIARCEKLVRCLASSTVLHCCSLISLEISSACDSVTSFPREGCLPASLERLYVEHFPSLDTLDCRGLLHLTSLQKLVIEDCPKLENIVGEKLPAALTHLYIGYSPLFGDRCHGRDPQIWPKISHIADIRVDLRRICDPGSSTDTDINVTDTDSDTEGRKGQNLGRKGYFKCFRM